MSKAKKYKIFRSCTHTEGNTDNWWRVTLAKTSAIKFVTVYNRVDNYQKRINGARVMLIFIS